MRIGVVSDTHLPRFGRQLPAALRSGLLEQRVDLILHLGDFTAAGTADLFERLAPFDAVAGNNDGEEIRRRFGRRKALELEGVRVGLAHGDQGRGRTTLDRALAAFADQPVHLVLFGHSHIPYLGRHGDRWVLNAGSATHKRRQPRYSYAIVDLGPGRLEPRLVFYDDRSPEAG